MIPANASIEEVLNPVGEAHDAWAALGGWRFTHMEQERMNLLLQDTFDVWDEKPQHWSVTEAAKELCRRIGGKANLLKYVDTLYAGRGARQRGMP
jgi:hypothetical protein